MSMTACAAIKDLIESEQYVQRTLVSDPTFTSGVYYQSLPENYDISAGDAYLIDCKDENVDYTTESILFHMDMSVSAFSISFERMDQVILPVLLDLLEDYEQAIQIAGHTVYNLEFNRITRAAVAEQDSKGNDVYMGEIHLRLEYNRPRKRSYNEFSQ